MKIARTVAFVFLVVALEIIDVQARSTGAPVSSNPEVCDTLTPGHQLPAQRGQSPYSIVPSSEKYMPGKESTVTINAPESRDFRGIFMQMRRRDSNAILGTWSVSDAQNFKTVSCTGGVDNAVTHQNKNGKGMSNTFKWMAPKDADADVYVAATFVENYATFWVNQTSQTISAERTTTMPTTTADSTTTTSSLILTIVMMSVSFFI